jgi:hypothetical protein
MISPAWMAVVGALGAAVIVQAIATPWEERRPEAALSDSLVMAVLYNSASLGSLALGIWAGVATTKRTSRPWAGWLVGPLATSLAAIAQMALVERGWAVEPMRVSAEE